MPSNRPIRITLAGPTGFHAVTIVGGHARKDGERYMGGHDTKNQHDNEAPMQRPPRNEFVRFTIMFP